mmetsp:Transcript_39181/g.28946  ORF Transcript_39181/g.28946 Transcript_39181/m.28946 type:complete len:256 (-) Transcript_39181:234-1001(-)
MMINALLICLTVLTAFVHGQKALQYKVLTFDTSYAVSNVPFTTSSRKLRNLAASGPSGSNAVTLETADQTVATLAFARSLASALGVADTNSLDSKVTYSSATRSETTPVTSTELTITVETAVDFSLSAFSDGVNSESAYVTNTVQKAINRMISNGDFGTLFSSLATSEGSTAFSTTAAVKNATATFGTVSTTTETYTYTIGNYHHGDPRRSGAKAGMVSVGVIIGAVLLGVSFCVLCFPFPSSSRGKIEDGIVSK